MKSQRPHTYEFGPFRLNPAEGQLLRNDEAVTLTPKAFEALVILVENQGHLIEKEDLMKALWPDTFVDEANLAHHVWRLRKALEDSKDGGRYIETVPKRGYRFVAPVKSLDGLTTEAIVEQHTITRLVLERETEDEGEYVEPTLDAPSHRRKTFSGNKTTALVTGLCVVALLAGTAYLKFRSDSTPLKAAASSPTTLAVLPFKPLNGESGDAALAMGMTDALITRLSNVKELTVRPTSAVMKYSSADGDSLIAARELRVESVLDGRVQRADDRIRITVQLIQSDGKPLWAETFDENYSNLFALEDSLSQKVARALALRLNPAEASRIQQHYTNNIEAYNSYLRGRYQMNLAAEGAIKAAASFKEAIDKDPKFALAYAGLADAHSALGFMGIDLKTPGEQFIKAKAAALKALELDDSLADAHVSLANVLFSYEWNWPEAEKEFKRAIELNPNLAEAHHWYSGYLQAMTRWDEALAEIKRAQELNPLSLTICFHYGLCLFGMGHDEEALVQYRRALDMDPTTGASGSNWGIAMIYVKRGMYEEAIREIEEANRKDPRPAFRLAEIAEFYARAGKRKEAEEKLEQLLRLRKEQFVSPISLAGIYGALGEKDRAFYWLNTAIDEKEILVVYLRAMELGDLRADPRYQLALHRVGLSFD